MVENLQDMQRLLLLLIVRLTLQNPTTLGERGQNENANGLLRQYFPKAMELDNIAVSTMIDAIDKLNSRPRKCLD